MKMQLEQVIATLAVATIGAGVASASALFALFSIVSKIFQYQAIDFYMVQELYKRSQLDED